MSAVADTKDWTFTLQRPCPQCGYDAKAVPAEGLPARLRDAASPWPGILAASGARDRPAPDVWSPLEYACHVRDVCRVMRGRVRLMLDQDDPEFDNWDQDASAVQERYGAQDPQTVGLEVVAAGGQFAELYAGLRADQWQRTGRRGDGATFTVDSIGRYALHELVHHLHDVAGPLRGADEG